MKITKLEKREEFHAPPITIDINKRGVEILTQDGTRLWYEIDALVNLTIDFPYPSTGQYTPSPDED